MSQEIEENSLGDLENEFNEIENEFNEIENEYNEIRNPKDKSTQDHDYTIGTSRFEFSGCLTINVCT